MRRRSRIGRYALALVALGFVGLAAGCGAAPDGGGSGGATPSAVAEGQIAPDFQLLDVNGNPVSLSDYDGQVRLVDFWATWCAPCREEVPMFKEFHEQYGPRGFTLLAISMDDDEALVEEFVAEHDIPYPNLLGNEEIERTFGPIVGYPMAFLLDRDGTIVKRFVGAKPREVLEDQIRELLEPEA
jgi:thiol-disulfide isomerase/thioredoxin